MKKKITIHDLAKMLQIDSSTVSRALANNPRVKKETRALIQQKALEAGYTRNTLASNLRVKKTHTIGVIVPHISRYFLSTVIAGIERVASQNGYKIIICQSLDDLSREKELIQTLISSQVDGIIISISMETKQFEHLQLVFDREIPIVFFDRKCEGLPASNVVIDDYARAYEATEHLIYQGCSKIAHFTGLDSISIYEDRLKGYLDALKNHEVSADESLIYRSRLKQEDGENMAKKILKRKNKPDGIFSANDISALAAMSFLQNNGVQVPEDLAIVGFSNEPIGAYTQPTLSTISQNPNVMGEMATEDLLKQINGYKPIGFQITTTPSNLIIRNSSVKKKPQK